MRLILRGAGPHYAWVILVSVMVMLSMSIGMMYSFGVLIDFLVEVEREKEVLRVIIRNTGEPVEIGAVTRTVMGLEQVEFGEIGDAASFVKPRVAVYDCTGDV